MTTAALSKQLHLARAERAAGQAFGWAAEERVRVRGPGLAHAAFAVLVTSAAASAILFYAAWDVVSF